MSEKKYEVVAKVGEGSFGSVFLVRQKTTDSGSQVLALKRIKKTLLSSDSDVKHTMTERNILAQISSPYVVKLHQTWQDDEFLYFLMDYHPGGDLKTLLMNAAPLKTRVARFYMAEILAAVWILHGSGIIHRDLKPENFLIDSSGHLIVIDFGLSKDMFEDEQKWMNTLNELEKRIKKKKYFTLVGTPNYISPAIASRKGYGKYVDYWSLGCILFEMLTGNVLFEGKSPKETLYNVMKFSLKEFKNPVNPETNKPYIKESAFDFIKLMLDSSNKKSEKKFIKSIKGHEFFRDIQDWDTIRQDLKPPFVPEVEDPFDISYFDTSYFNPNDVEGVLTPKIRGGKKPNQRFIGFTFKAMD